MIYIDASNEDGIGGADIIYQKEITRKIPGKRGCLKHHTVETFVHCIRNAMRISLKNVNISCKAPVLQFTDYNSSHLDYCLTQEKALEIESLLYHLAQENHKNKICKPICTLTKYKSVLNFLSSQTLSKELKVYGTDYYIIWPFYSSLYVDEKTETYVFDFHDALIAIGGIFGLYLGWSLDSIIMILIATYIKYKIP